MSKIQEVKNKLEEDESLNTDQSDLDADNPFNKRGERRNRRGKFKVVSHDVFQQCLWDAGAGRKIYSLKASMARFEQPAFWREIDLRFYWVFFSDF